MAARIAARIAALTVCLALVAVALVVPFRLSASAEPAATPMPPAHGDRPDVGELAPGTPDAIIPPLVTPTALPGAQPAAPVGAEAEEYWHGEYFDNRWLSGAPAVTRDDYVLQFDWDLTPPAPGVIEGDFSARWRRTLYFARAATYRVNVLHDDGVRVWVDNTLVLDQWTTCCQIHSADVFLAPGDHAFRVEYWQDYGGALLRFWVAPVAFAGWQGEYYNNDRLEGQPGWVSDDPNIDFDWQYGRPAPNVGVDPFSVRWTRDVVLNTAGLYRIAVEHDDGVRVWVDDVLRLDQWGTCCREDVAEVNLDRGSHRFRIEYFDRTGAARMKFTLQQPEVVCPSPLDLVLLLDGSGSIDAGSFASIKQFSRNLVASFSVSPASGHIGVVQFTDWARVETELADDAYRIIEVVDRMGQISGSTDIANGLQVAQSLIRQRGRPGVPHVIVLLSDGGHNTGASPITAATAIKAEGTVIFAVAVGSAYLDTLNAIASDPDHTHVFPVSDLGGLTGILRSLVSTTCPPTPIPSPTPRPAAVDAAGLDSQAEYPTVAPGGTLDYWINVRNTGNTTWRASAGYGWRGYGQWANRPPGSIWRDVPPGDVLSFQERVTVPDAPGEYIYGFMLHHNGVEFGPYFFLKVFVGNPVLEGRVQVLTNVGLPIDIEAALVQDGQGHSATTDLRGHFSFGQVAPGAYRLTVRKDGYTFEPQHVRVQRDTTASFMGRHVTIREIEINQALGLTANFVAGKHTVLRVRLANPVTLEPDRQTVEVRLGGSVVARLNASGAGDAAGGGASGAAGGGASGAAADGASGAAGGGAGDVLSFYCRDLAQCGGWQKGSYTFTASINGVTGSRTAAFAETRALRILAVRVRVNDHGVIREPGPVGSGLDDFLRHVFPLADDGLKWVNDPIVFDGTGYDLDRIGTCIPGFFPGRCNLIVDLKRRQLYNCNQPGGPACYDKIIGVIPPMPVACNPDGTGCIAGFVSGSEPTGAVVMEDGVFHDPTGAGVTINFARQAVAHEVGHTFGLGDEYAGGRFQCTINPAPPQLAGLQPEGSGSAQCTNGNVHPWPEPARGVIVYSDPVRPFEIVPTWLAARGALPNMLGFMGSPASQSDAWVTTWEWDHLFGRLKKTTTTSGAPSASSASPPITTTLPTAEPALGAPTAAPDAPMAVRLALVQGALMAATADADERATFDVGYSFQGNAPPAGTGSYILEAVNASEQVLASARLALSFVTYDNPPQIVDAVPFAVTLPFPANTVAFRLRRDAAILGRLPVSRAAPTVQVTAPAAGQAVNGPFTVRWQSADADGGPRYHTVQYSPDGQQWLTLATAITLTETLADFAQLPGGAQARVRVSVSDGLNTAEAESGRFTVSLKPPAVTITAPATGARFHEGAQVTLAGQAYDLQDGRLRAATQLRWTSDRAGALGSGEVVNVAALPRGRHTITLQAINTAGLTASATVQLQVGNPICLPLIAMSRPAAPPASACGQPAPGRWYTTRPLPVAMSAYWAATRTRPVYRGELYLFGGHNTIAPRQVDIYASRLQPDGTLGPWRAAGTMPGSYYDHVELVVGDRVYTLTGAAGSSDVFYAPLRSDGYVGPWRATTSLTPSRQNFAASAYNGRIYVSGGNTAGTTNLVQYATIQADGSLSGWRDAVPLPAAAEGHAMWAQDGWLYVLTPAGRAYRAAIGADGSLGAWRTDNPLPPVTEISALVHDRIVYLLDTPTGKVYWAPLLSGGGIGAWQAAYTLPAARRVPYLAASGCQLYILGGQAADRTLDEALMTQRQPVQ